MNEAKAKSYACKKLFFTATLLFILIIIINSISFNFDNIYENKYSERIEINVANMFENQGKFMNFGDIAALKFWLDADVSYMDEKDSRLGAKGVSYPVKKVSVGRYSEPFLDIKLTRGAFFTRTQHREGIRAAIISEKMAVRLFLTHDIIGNEIDIDGSKYIIVGLYKEKVSLLSFIYSDGFERVYIPFESIPGYENLPIKTVFIKGEKLEKVTFKSEEIKTALPRILRVIPQNYIITDFYNSHRIISQPLSLFIFLMGVWSCCILAGYFINFISYNSKYIRSKMQRAYLKEFLLTRKGYITAAILGGLLIVSAAFLIFKLVNFKGYMPNDFIPADNLFDLKFYVDKIKQTLFQVNRQAGYSPTYLNALQNNSIAGVCILMLFAIIAAFSTFSSIKLCKIVFQPNAKTLAIPAGSILAAIAAAYLLSLILGIKFNLPAKGIGTVSLLILLKMYSWKINMWLDVNRNSADSQVEIT